MKPASVSGSRIDKNVETWSNSVGDKLGKAGDTYNSATAALEARMLVSARRLRELKTGAVDEDRV